MYLKQKILVKIIYINSYYNNTIRPDLSPCRTKKIYSFDNQFFI